MASATYQPSSGKGSDAADKAKQAGNDVLDKAKQAGNDVLDKAKHAGADALEKTKEVGNDVLGTVKDAGNQALGKAKDAVDSVTDMATGMGKKADDMTSAAGHEIKEFGTNIGKKGPQDGVMGQASHALADTIKGSGEYLENAKLSGMAADVEQVVKNHPIPALLICLGIGYCIGRAMKD